MTHNTKDQMAQIFKASWDIYETILANDYMAHKRIFPIVQAACGEFVAQRGNRPISVWELGCGGAHNSSQMLRGLPISSYTGIDLAPNVLEVARENLAGLGCPVTLKAQDLFDAVQSPGEEADLVFASYAIHHLTSLEQKGVFFSSLFHKVRPGGIFILVDIFGDEGQNRGDILEGYKLMVRTEWTQFEGAVLEEVVNHVRDHDFPEVPSSVDGVAVRAGWSRGRELCRFGFHRAYLYSKPAL